MSAAHLAIAAVTAASTVASTSPTPEPLEVLAIDVRAFPQITVDIAVPERERARDLPVEAFSLPGLTDVSVEELDPADLTLAVVLDDGPEVRTAGLAFQQGSATELMRNISPDVEVMIHATSGIATEPTVDREAAIAAIGSTSPRSTSGTLTGAIADAAQRLETVTDGRRQLVVMTGEASDIPGDGMTSLLASLDRANAAMRVVSMGDAVGPNLMQTANDSGGAAAAVGWGSNAALRAVDVLTTTFAEQYRLQGTMPAPGPVTVRLTVDGRSYETTIPGVGVPPTTSTTAATPTTATTVAVATVPATAAASPTMGPGGTSSGDGSSTPVVEASLAIAALALIVAVVVTQRRRSRHRATGRRAATSRRR